MLVSVKLKVILQQCSQGARKIIEKAEKQLLQDRVRCINKTTEESGNTIINSRSRLMSTVTNATDLDWCSKFIDKVKEDRYGKVKERQVRKLNNLISKSNNNSNKAINNYNRLGQRNHANNSDRANNKANQLQANNNNKWVINLSKTNLTEGQESVLAKGPNFSITPKYIHNVDYIRAVESMSSKLKEEDAVELRLDINTFLRKAKVPKPNLIRQERIGLAQLKKDKDRVILTADKGVAMVVMNREEYITKAQELLAQPAYRLIPRDPTNKIKAQLITKLRQIKKYNNLDEGMYKAMYSTGSVPPSFMGYPKSIKQAILLSQ